MSNLKAYHLPGEDGEVVLEPVKPVAMPRLRMVAVSESDAEILENVGLGLARLGALDASNVCMGIAVQWKLGRET